MAVRQKVGYFRHCVITTVYFLSHLMFLSHSGIDPWLFSSQAVTLCTSLSLSLSLSPISFFFHHQFLFFNDSLSIRSKAGQTNSRNMSGDEVTTPTHIGNQILILVIVDFCRHETGGQEKKSNLTFYEVYLVITLYVTFSANS